MTKSDWPVHESATIFPEMVGDAFEALKKDIKDQGQREPILLLDGKVLDGRNRLRACLELDVDPKVVELAPEQCPDPLAFVMSRNYHRRHLTPAQCGQVLRRVVELRGGSVGKNKGGRPRKAEKHGGVRQVSVSSVAKELGIPRKTAEDNIKAADVYQALPPDLKANVDARELTLPAAQRIAAGQEAPRPKPAAARAKHSSFPAKREDRPSGVVRPEREFQEIMARTTKDLEHLAKEARLLAFGDTQKIIVRSHIKRQQEALVTMMEVFALKDEPEEPDPVASDASAAPSPAPALHEEVVASGVESALA